MDFSSNSNSITNQIRMSPDEQQFQIEILQSITKNRKPQQVQDRNSIIQSKTKKTKKKELIRIDEEDKIGNKQILNEIAQVPLGQKKKRGIQPNKNNDNIQENSNAISTNGNKLVSNLDLLESIKTESIMKQQNHNVNKANSNLRNSFQSMSSIKSVRSHSSNNSKSEQFKNQSNQIKRSNFQSKEKGQVNQSKNQKGHNFSSTITSLRNDGKKFIDPAEKKFQEEKKKYELQLKLIRIKAQEFSKKSKMKPLDKKNIQKNVVKQKLQEKITVINEGLRVMQNIYKILNDFESDAEKIKLEYVQTSDEMKHRYNFFEETVAPYEEKMQGDINLRNELILKTTDQTTRLNYQRQINSNIQEDNSSISHQTHLLIEQITSLKSKKIALQENQLVIDAEHNQLKQNADHQQYNQNILQKHYDEQASKSLWLKKEINLKKKGIFSINITMDNQFMKQKKELCTLNVLQNQNMEEEYINLNQQDTNINQMNAISPQLGQTINQNKTIFTNSSSMNQQNHERKMNKEYPIEKGHTELTNKNKPNFNDQKNKMNKNQINQHSRKNEHQIGRNQTNQVDRSFEQQTDRRIQYQHDKTENFDHKMIDQRTMMIENQMKDESKQWNYTCSINYLIQNEYELLRSITDFEYFTPNQIYAFIYEDNCAKIFLKLLEKFIFFFNQSKIKNSQLITYNNEGTSNYSISSSDTTFEKVIEQIKQIKIEDTSISLQSNLGFSLHLDVTNQQFYLGKQFNIIIVGVNTSTISQDLSNSIQHLLTSKKILQISKTPSNNTLFVENAYTNTNNQLNELLEGIQRQKAQNQLSLIQTPLLPNSKNENKENTFFNTDNSIQLYPQQQNQQFKAIKKVKYNDIEQQINKNAKSINFLQTTPKTQNKKEILQKQNSHIKGDQNKAGRSQSENRSGQKVKEKKQLENMQIPSEQTAQQQQKEKSDNILTYIEQFFRKTNRLYTLYFDSAYQHHY